MFFSFVGLKASEQSNFGQRRGYLILFVGYLFLLESLPLGWMGRLILAIVFLSLASATHGLIGACGGVLRGRPFFYNPPQKRPGDNSASRLFTLRQPPSSAAENPERQRGNEIRTALAGADSGACQKQTGWLHWWERSSLRRAWPGEPQTGANKGVSMLDTIAALIEPPAWLPDSLFSGGTVTEIFSSQEVTARLWLNPEKDAAYAPRMTYWRAVASDADGVPATGYLKAEFSIPKLLGGDLRDNPSDEQIQQALNQVDDFLRMTFGHLPGIRLWTAQRVDYAWNWKLGPVLPAYMSVLAKQRISTWSRHPYDAAEGVVWKSRSSRGRWVKFYNKALEMGLKSPDEFTLRFEVSNYRDAVKYMAVKWFGCERLVGEMERCGRALYCLGVHWDRLGLGVSDSFGHDEHQLMRLREAYGRKVSTAYYALRLIREYGPQAYAAPLRLIAKSAYYTWRRKLLDGGFLVEQEGKDVVVRQALPALHLPAQETFEKLSKSGFLVVSQNLGENQNPPAENKEKILWENLASGLGLNTFKIPKMSPYLLGQYDDFVGKYA